MPVPFEFSAGQRFAPTLAVAIEPERIFLADEHGHERIEAKLIVVFEIFVAQTKSKDPLLEEFDERVLDALAIPMIGEAARKLLNETESLFDLAKKQTRQRRKKPSRDRSRREPGENGETGIRTDPV